MAWGWGSRVGGVPVARRSPTLSARRCRRLGGGGPAHRHAPTATLRLQTRPSSNPRLWTRPVDTPHRFWPRPLPASRSVERPARCWGGGGCPRPCPRPVRVPVPVPLPFPPQPLPAPRPPSSPVSRSQGGLPPSPRDPLRSTASPERHRRFCHPGSARRDPPPPGTRVGWGHQQPGQSQVLMGTVASPRTSLQGGGTAYLGGGGAAGEGGVPP